MLYQDLVIVFKTMTMKDYENSVNEMFNSEYETLKKVHSEDEMENDQLSDSGAALESLFLTFQNYKSVNQLSPKQITNIRAMFSSFNEYGNTVGFIDSAMLFNNGKTGVLFQQAGISSRSLGESTDSKITYRELCGGLIADNNDYLVADYKFNYKKQPYDINIIHAASKMEFMMINIRNKLLQTDPQARSVFHKRYAGLLDYIKEVSKTNVGDAIIFAEFLCKYCMTFPNKDYYKTPKKLIVILNIMRHDFDAAKEYAKKNNVAHLISVIEEKRKNYHEVLCKEYYESAVKSRSSGNYKSAMESVLKSLEEKSTEEGWQLYVDLIVESASEKNDFNRDILSELLDDADVEPEQEKVLKANKDRLDELKTKIEEFNKKLCLKIQDKVIENDIEFFKENKDYLIDHVDENNMNALMYAALYHKTELFKLLVKQGYNTKLEGFCRFSCYELYSILCKDWEEYFSAVGKIDPRSVKMLSVAESERESAKKKLNSEKASGAVAGAADLIFGASDFMREFYGGKENLGTLASEVSSDIAAQSTEKIKQAQEEIEELERAIEEASDKLFRQRYNETWESIVYLLKSDDIPKFEDVPEEAEINEYLEAAGKFRDVFAVHLEEIVKEHAFDQIKPKDEFETTEQYEKRFHDSLTELTMKYVRPAYDNFRKAMSLTGKLIPSLKKTIGSLFEIQGAVTLEKYDADKGCFNASWKGFIRNESLTIDVPIAEAREFKEKFVDTGIPVKVTGFEKKGFSAICEAELNGKHYKYNLLQSNTVPSKLIR